MSGDKLIPEELFFTNFLLTFRVEGKGIKPKMEENCIVSFSKNELISLNWMTKTL